jgi:hypothetical protein
MKNIQFDDLACCNGSKGAVQTYTVSADGGTQLGGRCSVLGTRLQRGHTCEMRARGNNNRSVKLATHFRIVPT